MNDTAAPSEKMIVGWDRTLPARSALTWAVSRAIARAEPLDLIRVVDNSISSAEYFVSDSAAAAARITLLDDTEEVRNQHPLANISSELVIGDPSIELARLSGPRDMVVVGTHRREGLLARFSWSVGARLSRHSGGPVAIIPEDDDRERHGVVVGVDWSATSRAAILFAAGEAVRCGEDLIAIHAWHEPVFGGSDAQPSADLQRMREETLEATLRPVVARYPALTIQAKVLKGRPEDILTNASRDAALVVIGNHGAAGIIDRMLGSVCSALILAMHGPLVVVRLAGHDA